MSEYFRALEQILHDRSHDPEAEHPEAELAPAPATVTRPLRKAKAGERPPARAAIEGRAAARPSGARLAAFSALLENLRALLSDDTTRALVLAGCGHANAAGIVAAGLSAQAERVGVSVIQATLTTAAGCFILRRCRRNGEVLVDAGDPIPLDLHGLGWRDEFAHWLRGASPNRDLVIIEGTPIASSVESLLLASACSGLVIVAETGVTSRSALRLAVEQACASRCRTLGLVMHGTKDQLPRWLRRLSGDPDRSTRLSQVS